MIASGTAYQDADSLALASPRLAHIADDKAMLRAAVELTRDFSAARGDRYWPDMLGSALVGYGALIGAIIFGMPGTLGNPMLAVLCGLLSADRKSVV